MGSPAPTRWRKLGVNWVDQFEAEPLRKLKGLDREASRRIVRYLDKHPASEADPRRFDQPLPADPHVCWRDRAGDYRVIARIRAQRIFVLIVRVDHRKDV